MKIIKVVPSGYCKGVIRAIQTVKETISKYPNENIYILGMLVHNRFVVEALRQQNVITLLSDKKDKISIIISGIYLIISFVLLGLIIAKCINTKNLDSANLETTLFLLISVIYFFFYYIKNKDKTNLLTDIKGNKLPTGNSKDDKNIRKKSYLKESLVFSIVVVCLDLMSILILNNKDDLFMFGVNNTLNIIFNVGITFVLCFGISYLFSMILDKVILKNRKEKN